MNSDESEDEDVEACRIEIREPSSIHGDNVVPDVLIFPGKKSISQFASTINELIQIQHIIV